MSIVGEGSSLKEFIYGSISGLAFGLVSPFAAQPFDTLKTKMQAQSRYAGSGVVDVARAVIETEGYRGFFRGITPLVLSTGVQKTALFAAYAGARRACENSGSPALQQPLPLLGVSPSIIVGGIAAGTPRTVVETPFELAKVRFQTGSSLSGLKAGTGLFSVGQLAELYTGAFQTWARGTVMLTTFFVLVDYSERAAPDLMSRPLLGGFLKGGVCATASWVVAWPLEVAKNKVQGAEKAYEGQSTAGILRQVVRSEGVRGLFRGLAPGAMRSFTANGMGMAVYQLTQSMRRDAPGGREQ